MARFRMRIRRVILLLLVVATLFAASKLLKVIDLLQVTRIDLATDIFIFQGFEANSVLLVGNEGSVLVDPLPGRLGKRELKEVNSLSERPLKFLINTHYHEEETRNNLLFVPGPTVVATDNAARRMEESDKPFWSDASHKAGLPTERFQMDLKQNRSHILPLDKDYVRVVYVGKGHTDGDLVVYLPSHGVVLAGDLVFAGYYPIVDHAGGGSYLDWIEALDRILALGPQRVVPGHGPVIEASDVKAFQGYLRDLVDEVARLKSSGKTKAQVMTELRLPVHEGRMKSLINPLNQQAISSLAANAGDVYDELEAGGKIPPRAALDVDAQEGEPDDNGDEEGASGEGGASSHKGSDKGSDDNATDKGADKATTAGSTGASDAGSGDGKPSTGGATAH